MKTLKNWTLQKQSAHHVELLVDEQHTLCLYVLEANLFRVLIKRKGELALARTWSIAPGEDVPWEGRSREDLSGFSLPEWKLEQQQETLTVESEQLRVTVHQPLWLEWHYRNEAGEWQWLAGDRPTSAYQINAHGDGVAHYLSRKKEERFYGLGEKAGNLQRTGQRYEMRNLDAMGYNAASTDPLYKHVPFTLTRRMMSATGCFTTTSAAAGWISGMRSITTTPPIAAGRRKRAISITTFLPARARWMSPKPLCA